MKSRYIFELEENGDTLELTNLLDKKLGIKIEIFYIKNSGNSLSYLYIRDSRKEWAIKISQLPNQCSWIFASELGEYTFDHIKEKLQVAEYIAKLLKYSHVLISLSDRQSEILSYVLKNDYKLILENMNPHSQHLVFLLCKEMVHKEVVHQEYLEFNSKI